VSWFYAALGLVALIVLHEAGHFAAAKAVGMRVERFSLFFGRTPLRFRRGETEYGVGWIPLGGYVKISGMTPHEELPPEAVSRAYMNQPVWKRLVVIFAGPAMNGVIAFVLLAVMFGAFAQKPTTTVGTVQAQPAKGVLHAGDRILKVDGHRATSTDAVRRAIASHHCAGTPTNGCRAATPVRLRIRRDGHVRSVKVRPRYSAQLKRTLVGFQFGTESVSVAPLTAASRSGDEMGHVITATGSGLTHIFQSKGRKQLSGIVGITDVTAHAFSTDTVTAIYLLAVISLSLAIVNLFPFLPLDGGHIFWALVEKLRGRAVPFAIIERSSAIGFALVIFLFAIGLSNDIGKINGGGFGL
jgi:regulator of sigma E protease